MTDRTLLTALAVLAHVGCGNVSGLEPGSDGSAVARAGTAPATVVLFACSPREDDGVDSATLFSDGRLELRVDGFAAAQEHFALNLAEQEAEALFRIALEHGLADHPDDQDSEGLPADPRSIPGFAALKSTTVLVSPTKDPGTRGQPRQVETSIQADAGRALAWTSLGTQEIEGLLELQQRIASLDARARLGQASPPAEVDYRAAKFSLSADRTKPVLIIQSQAGLTKKTTSMLLYSDGRGEIRVEVGDRVRERFEIQLEYGDVEELLRSAVHHGLAEFDPTRVRASQLRKRCRRPYTGPEDGSRLTVSLTLESYFRGKYALQDLEVTAQLDSPRLAARAFPQVPEILGMAELEGRLFNQLESARLAKGGSR